MREHFVNSLWCVCYSVVDVGQFESGGERGVDFVIGIYGLYIQRVSEGKEQSEIFREDGMETAPLNFAASSFDSNLCFFFLASTSLKSFPLSPSPPLPNKQMANPYEYRFQPLKKG